MLPVRRLSGGFDLCRDFPTIRFIIPHGWGGGALSLGPLPWPGAGPETPAADAAFGFDTCVYHQAGIDLLTRVVPADNILFASEMVGAVRGVDPEPGHFFDDTKRYVDASPFLSDADGRKILADNALTVWLRSSRPEPGRRRPPSRPHREARSPGLPRRRSAISEDLDLQRYTGRHLNRAEHLMIRPLMSFRSAGPDACALSPFTYALCGAGLAAMHGLTWCFGFRTDSFTIGQFGLIIAIGALLRSHRLLRALPRFGLTTETVLLTGLAFDFSLTFPWQVQAFALPLRDEAVRAFDLSLGFDHASYLAMLNGHPWLILTLAIVYKTFVPQVGFLIGLLLVTGKGRELDRYLSAFIIAIGLTSLISVLVPTIGIVAFLDPDLARTPAGPHWATDVTAYRGLRDGSLRDLHGVPVLGIISFPSFHAASVVLVTWGLRSFKCLFGPFLVLNAIMLVATVGCGGHYVADVLCACAVAATAIFLARLGSDRGYALALACRTFGRQIVVARAPRRDEGGPVPTTWQPMS